MGNWFHRPKQTTRSGIAHTLSRRELLIAGAAAAAGIPLMHRYGPRPVRGRDWPQRPNIVVFLADTFRADHLGCYGHRYPTSPNIDAFAEESLLFERCYSQCCWTKPSVASLFTGLLPRVHQSGLSEWNINLLDEVPVQVLRPEFTTPAQLMKRAGYQTAYLLSNAHLQRQFGFARGFEQYQYVNTWPPADQVSVAIQWLRSRAHEPFFLFVHEIDPHSPYTPWPGHYWQVFNRTIADAEAELTKDELDLVNLLQNPPPVPKGMSIEEWERQKARLSPQGQAYLSSRYDGEIRRVDDLFGKLLQCLEETGLADDTAVVFVSDHGESHGEHGHYFHGNALHNPEIHVPLIVRLPKGLRRRERVPWTVSQFDLNPTLLTLAGTWIPGYQQAESLLASDGSLAVNGHRECFASFGEAKHDLPHWDASMIHGDWKVRRPLLADRPAVYNLADDPGENHDLAAPGAAMPAAIRKLVDRFDHAQERHLALSATLGRPIWTRTDAVHTEELNALGYL